MEKAETNSKQGREGYEIEEGYIWGEKLRGGNVQIYLEKWGRRVAYFEIRDVST